LGSGGNIFPSQGDRFGKRPWPLGAFYTHVSNFKKGSLKRGEFTYGSTGGGPNPGNVKAF